MDAQVRLREIAADYTLYIYVYIHMSIYICIYMYICMYIYVPVPVCKSGDGMACIRQKGDCRFDQVKVDQYVLFEPELSDKVSAGESAS